MSNSSNNLSCIEHIMQFNADLHPYQTLSFLVPTNNTVWTERDLTWTVFFSIIIGILCLIYFCVGLTSVILMVRKNSLRITTKTFFAVYLTMAILGFSRTALLLLDPFGILGFIGNQFSAWVIVSRFLGSLGFPSLVGACTLIIMTLVKLAHAGTGKQWYEYWSLVLALIIIPYAIALFAEGLGHIETFAALLSGLICEIFFVVWGVTICIFYLIAGKRLLNMVKQRHRRATMLSESGSTSNAVQHDQANSESLKYYAHHNNRAQRIKKKIIVISFGTAVAGVFYALVSAGGVTMVLLLIFYDCMGLKQPTNSVVWLVVQLLNYMAEVVLTLFILYSMTDVTKFVEFLKFALSCCYCCFAKVCIGSEEDPMPSSSMSQPMADSRGTASSNINSREEADNTEMQRGSLESTDISVQNRIMVDRQQRFKIDVHDSDSSIGSGEAPPPEQSSQQLIRENGEAKEQLKDSNSQPGKKVSIAQLQTELMEHMQGGRKISATRLEEPTEQKQGKKVSIAQLQGGLIEQTQGGRKISLTRLEGPIEPKQRRKISASGLVEQAQGGRKISASRLEEPAPKQKKISLSRLFELPTEQRQKQRLDGYNSMDDIRQDAQPLDVVGQLLSVKNSPTLSHKPLRFFRRPNQSRETTPSAESQDRGLAQASELRKLRHFPSSPATPTIREAYSKHFSSSHPVKSPHLQTVTSPLTPDSPISPYKTSSETQKLLEKHDSTSKLSRKGTI